MTVLSEYRQFDVCSQDNTVSVRCASNGYEICRDAKLIDGLGEIYPSKMGVGEITFVAPIVLTASEIPASFVTEGCKVTLNEVTFFGRLSGCEGHYVFTGRTLGMEGYVGMNKKFDLFVPPDVKAPWAGVGWF